MKTKLLLIKEHEAGQQEIPDREYSKAQASPNKQDEGEPLKKQIKVISSELKLRRDRLVMMKS